MNQFSPDREGRRLGLDFFLTLLQVGAKNRMQQLVYQKQGDYVEAMK